MQQKSLVTIAFRNLFRHWRRSIITGLSVTLSAGLVFFVLGFYRGTYDEMMFESFIRFKSGHLTIQTPYYDERDITKSLDSVSLFTNAQEITNNLYKLPDIRAVSMRTMSSGFIGNGREKYPVLINGIDPKNENKVGVVSKSITSGQFLLEREGAMMGKPLAELFGFKVGDLCYIQAQTVYNTPNLIIVPIVGIFSTGFNELDKGTVFISNNQSVDLFATESSMANRLIVYLHNTKSTEVVKEEVHKILGNKLIVKSWRDYAQALIKDSQSDRFFFNIIIGILMLIAVATIMSTMYMSVYERIREIGTLRAIGWFSKDIYKLFIYESLIIGVAGSFVGLLFGGIPTLYMMFIGVDYSQAGELISVPIFKLTSHPLWTDLIWAFLVGILSTFIGGFFPARKARKMAIVDALNN